MDDTRGFVLIMVTLLMALVFAQVMNCRQRAHAQQLHVQPAEALRDALLSRVSVGRTYIAHCRQAKGGCVQRVGHFARWFVEAGQRYGLDAYLLAAMAIRESGLNPHAQGDVGELGLMQLHPYSAAGMRAKMVCRRAPSDCTYAVIFEAAAHLAECMRVCGDLERSLGRFNSGRCIASAYSRRVIREWEGLR
jgi:hypothetical protein